MRSISDCVLRLVIVLGILFYVILMLLQIFN